MSKPIERNTIKIDAANQAVGRVASQVAMALQGKNKPNFERHIDGGDFVIVNNAGKVKFTGKKLEQKDYYSHTMHPGGLKRLPAKKLFEKDHAELIRRAVYGMVPKNKLRGKIIKRLTVNA